MASLALYRKYRSKSFAELVGQDHISKTLSNALSSGKISHAYLFTGPRGVGKTSAARIFAREANGNNPDANDVDIIEIDAASNNGVDEIRELREKVHVAPNYAQYKIYIIDEVHMLSNAAFNALLKTLEEPPSHVIFIMATTEPHKLPATIISRTQHFPFRPVNAKAVAVHLKTIAEAEQINIDAESLQALAKLGEGSIRDSISLLDQISNVTGGKIDINTIRQQLGLAQNTQLESVILAVAKQEPDKVITALDGILDSGVTAQQLLKQLLNTTRDYIRANLAKGANEQLQAALEITRNLSQLHATSSNLEIAIESELLKLALGSGYSPGNTSNDTRDVKPSAPSVKPSQPTQQTKVDQHKPAPKKSALKNQTKPKTSSQSTVYASSSDGNWVRILSYIKELNNSLYAVLRSCQVEFAPPNCVITAKFQFHLRRLEEPLNRTLIAEAITHCSGGDAELCFQLAGNKAKKPVDAKDDDKDAVSQVMQILGGEMV